MWLTQKMMADLFGTTTQNVQQHLDAIYRSGELDEDSTIKIFLTVRQEGSRTVNRSVKHYNLDAIIAVGYRVNSKQATHFRQWATQVLKEYIIKGFALDDDRLKQAKTVLGKTTFKNCWNEFAPSEQANSGSGFKLLKYSRNAASTTTVIHWKQDAFLQLFRTVFTLPSTIKLPPRLFMPEQTTRSHTWV